MRRFNRINPNGKIYFAGDGIIFTEDPVWNTINVDLWPSEENNLKFYEYEDGDGNKQIALLHNGVYESNNSSDYFKPLLFEDPNSWMKTGTLVGEVKEEWGRPAEGKIISVASSFDESVHSYRYNVDVTTSSGEYYVGDEFVTTLYGKEFTFKVEAINDWMVTQISIDPYGGIDNLGTVSGIVLDGTDLIVKLTTEEITPDIEKSPDFVFFFNEYTRKMKWYIRDYDNNEFIEVPLPWGGGSGTTIWGEILGDISEQLDLMDELNKKVDHGTESDDWFAAGKTAEATGIMSFAVGLLAKATGLTSFAVGNGSSAQANNAFAVGGKADQPWAMAIGVSSHADEVQTMAVGNGSRASDEGAMAIGHTAKARGEKSVAIWKNSHSIEENEFSVGSPWGTDPDDPMITLPNIQRRITNVADPVEDTDAVNKRTAVTSILDEEPTGSLKIGNMVTISKTDYDTAEGNMELLEDTFYFVIED